MDAAAVVVAVATMTALAAAAAAVVAAETAMKIIERGVVASLARRCRM